MGCLQSGSCTCVSIVLRRAYRNEYFTSMAKNQTCSSKCSYSLSKGRFGVQHQRGEGGEMKGSPSEQAASRRRGGRREESAGDGSDRIRGGGGHGETRGGEGGACGITGGQHQQAGAPVEAFEAIAWAMRLNGDVVVVACRRGLGNHRAPQ